MRQLSKVTPRRNQWPHQAKERGDQKRYLRKQLARVNAERDQATQARPEARAPRRERASHAQAVVVGPKVEVVWIALPLFLEAPSSLRAVSRVLTLLTHVLGLKQAPGPPTVLHGVRRLSLVRRPAAHLLRGLPLSPAPLSQGLSGRSALSMGLDTGQMGAGLALDAPHPPRPAGAPRLQQVRGLVVSVAASWTGAPLADGLKPRSAVLGRPAAYRKDGGSDRHQALSVWEAQGLASPALADLAHAGAGLLQRPDQPPPACARFVSAWGRVSGQLKHTSLACVVPPPVRTQARFLHGHRLCTWADRVLQLSPAGGAKTGSSLRQWRACLDELPTCTALGLLACQRMLKTTGLSPDTRAACAPLLDALPSAPVRLECRAYLAVQLPGFCAMKGGIHWGSKCAKVHSCKEYISSYRANERKGPLAERSAPCTRIRR